MHMFILCGLDRVSYNLDCVNHGLGFGLFLKKLSQRASGILLKTLKEYEIMIYEIKK
jgi:hypothetical protein